MNDGKITLYAKNDGINAAPKVNSDVAIEVNGGTIDVRMGSGDTDAFDANGNIYINGGTKLPHHEAAAAEVEQAAAKECAHNLGTDNGFKSSKALHYCWASYMQRNRGEASKLRGGAS